MFRKLLLAAAVIVATSIAMHPGEADARRCRCNRGYYGGGPARVSYGYAPRYYGGGYGGYGGYGWGGPGYWGPRNQVGVSFGRGSGFYYGW